MTEHAIATTKEFLLLWISGVICGALILAPLVIPEPRAQLNGIALPSNPPGAPGVCTLADRWPWLNTDTGQVWVCNDAGQWVVVPLN